MIDIDPKNIMAPPAEVVPCKDDTSHVHFARVVVVSKSDKIADRTFARVLLFGAKDTAKEYITDLRKPPYDNIASVVAVEQGTELLN